MAQEEQDRLVEEREGAEVAGVLSRGFEDEVEFGADAGRAGVSVFDEGGGLVCLVRVMDGGRGRGDVRAGAEEEDHAKGGERFVS